MTGSSLRTVFAAGRRYRKSPASDGGVRAATRGTDGCAAAHCRASQGGIASGYTAVAEGARMKAAGTPVAVRVRRSNVPIASPCPAAIASLTPTPQIARIIENGAPASCDVSSTRLPRPRTIWRLANSPNRR